MPHEIESAQFIECLGYSTIASNQQAPTTLDDKVLKRRAPLHINLRTLLRLSNV